MSQNNGSSTSLRLKTGLAEMLKGGVIMETFRRSDADLLAFVDADGATPPAPTAVSVPPPPPTVPQFVLALGAWSLLGGLVLATGPIFIGILAPLPDQDVAAAAAQS